MKLVIEKSVTVITPSIGKSTLHEAISSVWDQDYSNITHLIVADGKEYEDKCNFILSSTNSITKKGQKTIVTSVPFNTGGAGFYGHRIYAAFAHLMNTDYILFLDEDNWFKPNHVSSMVRMMDQRFSAGFGYSLRSIYSVDGEYLLDDNCESLGNWPIYWSLRNPEKQRLIDTSCFIFRRDFLEITGHLWHSGWGGDRTYYNEIKNYEHHTTGQHTVCYRLDGNPKSVNKQFFEKGNAETLAFYRGKLPWVNYV